MPFSRIQEPLCYPLGKCVLNKWRKVRMIQIPRLSYSPHSRLRSDSQNVPLHSPCCDLQALCALDLTLALWIALLHQCILISSPFLCNPSPSCHLHTWKPKLLHTEIIIHNSLMWWVKRVFSLTWNNALIPKDENSGIRNKLLQGWPFARGSRHKPPWNPFIDFYLFSETGCGSLPPPLLCPSQASPLVGLGSFGLMTYDLWARISGAPLWRVWWWPREHGFTEIYSRISDKWNLDLGDSASRGRSQGSWGFQVPTWRWKDDTGER